MIPRLFDMAGRAETFQRQGALLRTPNLEVVPRSRSKVATSSLSKVLHNGDRWQISVPPEGIWWVRCYYNFVRPHGALKFGCEVRTPAMQAGLVSNRLSLREIFVAELRKILFAVVFIDVTLEAGRVREQKLAA
jgi:hypothetical protein